MTDYSNPKRSHVKSWRGPATMSLQNKLMQLAKLDARELEAVDFDELRSLITTFENLRMASRDLGASSMWDVWP